MRSPIFSGLCWNVAVVDSALHDLAEQRQDPVDRRVRQRALATLVRLPRLALDGLHQRLAASLGFADHARAVRQPVAETVDARDIDLSELHAPEVPDQIAELPLKVGDRVCRRDRGSSLRRRPFARTTRRAGGRRAARPPFARPTSSSRAAPRCRARPSAGSPQARSRRGVVPALACSCRTTSR